MLDASVVHSKGGGGRSMHTLNPTAPDLIIDGGADGATLTVVSGTVITAPIGNDFVPGTWVPAGAGQAVPANARQAFKQSSRDHAVVSFVFA
jgi:hypothetical protein